MIDTAELINLYHLARVALDNPGSHARMVWAVNQYCLEHAIHLVETDTKRIHVYKALDAALR